MNLPCLYNVLPMDARKGVQHIFTVPLRSGLDRSRARIDLSCIYWERVRRARTFAGRKRCSFARRSPFSEAARVVSVDFPHRIWLFTFNRTKVPINIPPTFRQDRNVDT